MSKKRMVAESRFRKRSFAVGFKSPVKSGRVSIAEIENSVAKIAKWAQNRGEKEMNSKLLGQIVMSELKALDDVAYVRFASVYKTFKDIHEFVESLEQVDPEFPQIATKDVNA
jgi:transcriptional repressor NrdR